MYRETTIDIRYEQPLMQRFLNGVVERYFPREYAPDWIKYDLFRDDMKENLFDELKDYVDGVIQDEYAITFFSLLYAYSPVGWEPSQDDEENVTVPIPADVIDEFLSLTDDR